MKVALVGAGRQGGRRLQARQVAQDAQGVPPVHAAAAVHVAGAASAVAGAGDAALKIERHDLE